MDFDWGALGTVAVIGIGSTVLLVALFCVGIAALSRRDAAVSRGANGALAFGSAVTCFAICTAAVLLGLYLIIPIFHE